MSYKLPLHSITNQMSMMMQLSFDTLNVHSYAYLPSSRINETLCFLQFDSVFDL